jgi:hypothetical protein
MLPSVTTGGMGGFMPSSSLNGNSSQMSPGFCEEEVRRQESLPACIANILLPVEGCTHRSLCHSSFCLLLHFFWRTPVHSSNPNQVAPSQTTAHLAHHSMTYTHCLCLWTCPGSPVSCMEDAPSVQSLNEQISQQVVKMTEPKCFPSTKRAHTEYKWYVCSTLENRRWKKTHWPIEPRCNSPEAVAP